MAAKGVFRSFFEGFIDPVEKIRDRESIGLSFHVKGRKVKVLQEPRLLSFSALLDRVLVLHTLPVDVVKGIGSGVKALGCWGKCLICWTPLLGRLMSPTNTADRAMGETARCVKYIVAAVLSPWDGILHPSQSVYLHDAFGLTSKKVEEVRKKTPVQTETEVDMEGLRGRVQSKSTPLNELKKAQSRDFSQAGDKTVELANQKILLGLYEDLKREAGEKVARFVLCDWTLFSEEEREGQREIGSQTLDQLNQAARQVRRAYQQTKLPEKHFEREFRKIYRQLKVGELELNEKLKQKLDPGVQFLLSQESIYSNVLTKAIYDRIYDFYTNHVACVGVSKFEEFFFRRIFHLDSTLIREDLRKLHRILLPMIHEVFDREVKAGTSPEKLIQELRLAICREKISLMDGNPNKAIQMMWVENYLKSHPSLVESTRLIINQQIDDVLTEVQKQNPSYLTLARSRHISTDEAKILQAHKLICNLSAYREYFDSDEEVFEHVASLQEEGKLGGSIAALAEPYEERFSKILELYEAHPGAFSKVYKQGWGGEENFDGLCEPITFSLMTLEICNPEISHRELEEALEAKPKDRFHIAPRMLYSHFLDSHQIIPREILDLPRVKSPIQLARNIRSSFKLWKSGAIDIWYRKQTYGKKTSRLRGYRSKKTSYFLRSSNAFQLDESGKSQFTRVASQYLDDPAHQKFLDKHHGVVGVSFKIEGRRWHIIYFRVDGNRIHFMDSNMGLSKNFSPAKGGSRGERGREMLCVLSDCLFRKYGKVKKLEFVDLEPLEFEEEPGTAA